jgi:type IV pilus assembly protein PilB
LRARKKLGEILVEGGLLTRKQLEEALPFQKKSNMKLGQFLVREGASDIHVSPEKESVQVRFRVDGRLHEVPAPPKSMFLPMWDLTLMAK